MKPMLAGKFPGDDKLRFPLFVQPKLDGIRCVIVDGKALTRTLKPVPNAEIQAILGWPDLNGLDGELIVGDPTAPDCYRQTCSFVMSEDKRDAPWSFYVFDRWDQPDSRFSVRYETLKALASRLRGEGRGELVIVPSTTAQTLDDMRSIEQGFVESGHEGVILRGPESLYKFGRGNATNMDLLKVKRFTDSEALVLDCYEERHNANEVTTNALGRTERSSHQANKIGKGTLGGLEVQLLNDHAGFKAGTMFRIGTGFDAQERAEIWKMFKTDPDRCPVGWIAKFKHFEVGAKDKPRHPVFLGWRDERDM